MTIILYVFLALIALTLSLAVNVIISLAFACIADDKGHRWLPYFFFTFFFGIVGMLMVVALPDRKNIYLRQYQSKSENSTVFKDEINSKNNSESNTLTEEEIKRSNNLDRWHLGIADQGMLRGRCGSCGKRAKDLVHAEYTDHFGTCDYDMCYDCFCKYNAKPKRKTVK